MSKLSLRFYPHFSSSTHPQKTSFTLKSERLRNAMIKLQEYSWLHIKYFRFVTRSFWLMCMHTWWPWPSNHLHISKTFSDCKDCLIAAGTLPYHSWCNPVERDNYFTSHFGVTVCWKWNGKEVSCLRGNCHNVKKWKLCERQMTKVMQFTGLHRAG